MSAQVPTLRDIRSVLPDAPQSEVDAEEIADFLAGVDWGRLDPASREARLLGQLEGWTTAYGEGDMTQAEYVARLLSARPETAAAGKK